MGGTRLWALVIALAVMVLACSGGGDGATTSTNAPTTADATVTATAATSPTEPPASTPTAMATPQPPAGDTWETIRFPDSPRAVAVAGDRLWVADFAGGEFTLSSSTDFETWDVVDLHALGLPRGGGADMFIGRVELTAAGDVLYGVFATPPSGLSVEGASGDVWIVRVDGSDVEVLDSTVTGIDQRVSGPKNFRFALLHDMTSRGDEVHVVLDGTWWVPNSTVDSDFAMVSLLGADPWVTFSQDRDDVSGRFQAVGIVNMGDSLVVAGEQGQDPKLVGSRVSADGVTWVDGASPPLEDWSFFDLTGMAASDDRVVVLGHARDDDVATKIPIVWSSPDGLTWDSQELPNPGGEPMETSAAVWTGERFLVFAASSYYGASTTWASNDGVGWEIIRDASAEPGLERVGDAIMWNGRVVLLTDRGFGVSPPRS